MKSSIKLSKNESRNQRHMIIFLISSILTGGYWEHYGNKESIFNILFPNSPSSSSFISKIIHVNCKLLLIKTKPV